MKLVIFEQLRCFRGIVSLQELDILMAATRRALVSLNVAIILATAAGNNLQELVVGELTLQDDLAGATDAGEPREVG